MIRTENGRQHIFFLTPNVPVIVTYDAPLYLPALEEEVVTEAEKNVKTEAKEEGKKEVNNEKQEETKGEKK